jgi:hypothetical protein
LSRRRARRWGALAAVSSRCRCVVMPDQFLRRHRPGAGTVLVLVLVFTFAGVLILRGTDVTAAVSAVGTLGSVAVTLTAALATGRPARTAAKGR